MTQAIAEESLRIAQEAVTRRGRCVICLSGGSTPKALNELWARDYSSRMPWNQIHFFWGDERYVPADDPHSNYCMARESLIAHVAIPAQNIHPMPTNYSQPDEAAREYEAELRRFFGASPEFDIAFSRHRHGRPLRLTFSRLARAQRDAALGRVRQRAR